MNFYLLLENLRIAWHALLANKLRSGLTMLGIIIGVAAVVALMSVGQGATSGITSQVQSLGTNLITISAGRSFFRPGQAMTFRDENVLYYRDYEAIARAVGQDALAAPYYQFNSPVTYESREAQYAILGVTPAYRLVRSYNIARGRFLVEQDNLAEARVAVLGAQTASELFGGLNPIGRQVTIQGLPFTIVGVLEAKGSMGFGGTDDVVLIPLETGYSRLFGGQAIQNGKRILSGILLSAYQAEQVDDIMLRAEYTLRKQHHLTLRDELGFTISSQSQMLSTLSDITNTMTAMLGAIAAISLLVGGIGIMNITLVSVRERTREIGLRKAVGAKRRAILIQFLVETMVLSITGGLIGILLGSTLAAILNAGGLITTRVTVDVILLAFLSAATVGLFFGIYPAYQAARMHPMEALRYE